ARRNVLLMERLGPQLAELKLPKAQELAAICATLQAAWAPAAAGFITAAEMAREMAATIEDLQARLGAPCPARALAQALDCARRRARAFDPAISMREWPEGLPAGDVRAAGEARLRLLGELTGVEARPIWEWSLVQLVWNGILLVRVGAGAAAELEFALADAFCR